MKKYTIIDLHKCNVDGVDGDVFVATDTGSNDPRRMFFDFEEVGTCHRRLISKGAKFIFLRYYLDYGSGRQRIQELLFCDDNFENIVEAEDFDFAAQKALIKYAKVGVTTIDSDLLNSALVQFYIDQIAIEEEVERRR